MAQRSKVETTPVCWRLAGLALGEVNEWNGDSCTVRVPILTHTGSVTLDKLQWRARPSAKTLTDLVISAFPGICGTCTCSGVFGPDVVYDCSWPSLCQALPRP